MELTFTVKEWSEILVSNAASFLVVGLMFGAAWMILATGLRCLFDLGMDVACRFWPRFEKLRCARCQACERPFDFPKG